MKNHPKMALFWNGWVWWGIILLILLYQVI